MNENIAFFEDFIFRKTNGVNRFTQDSPIFPEVWAQYFMANKDQAVDLIFTTHRKYAAAQLLTILRENLLDYHRKSESKKTTFSWSLATSGETIAGKLTFEELIHVALPLTSWWEKYLWISEDNKASMQKSWFKEMVMAITWYQREKHLDMDAKALDALNKKLLDEFYLKEEEKPSFNRSSSSNYITPIWAISWNRPASISLYRSNKTIKSESTRRLFKIDGTGITWAVIDSGIDATHLGFRLEDKATKKHFDFPFIDDERQVNKTRIKATYDFTKLRDIMTNIEGLILADVNKKKVGTLKSVMRKETITTTSDDNNKRLSKVEFNNYLKDLERIIKNGRDLDWSVLGPLIRIPHRKDLYTKPQHPHGTHVAGIIGANMELSEGTDGSNTLMGVCPGIELYDLRVFNKRGKGDEFCILAALQFVRWLNRQKDKPLIHGVNLSMSLKHEVKNYACGRTPICDECDRLVGQGAVVVAAAGNAGRSMFQSDQGFKDEGYRNVSITDPGNAELAITVGATHRNKPHTYGVSYFSSRGPTGDGRMKPDIVAPGEKIVSLYPDNKEERLDGTSMAAPHVSGAAALLLCKNRELIGNPSRIKEILCSTATDLGRERYFQGAGLVDILRALQSV